MTRGGVRALAALMLPVALACAGVAWDPERLTLRFPSVASLDRGLLRELTPYLLPTRAAVTLFTCRWTVEQPVPVALPEGATAAERRAVDAALLAWEHAGLGLRFVRVSASHASIRIELADGPVATAGGPGSGNTGAVCRLAGPRLPEAGEGVLEAELSFASVRVARRTPADARGRDRALSAAELAGVTLHELGHALGWQGHVGRGRSAMRRDVAALRRLGASLLDGEAFVDPALQVLYALPSGVVLAQIAVAEERTEWIDRMAELARINDLEGPLARVGDATARIFWRKGRREYGLQVINLHETLRHPERLVVAPEAFTWRELAPRGAQDRTTSARWDRPAWRAPGRAPKPLPHRHP